MPHLHANTLIMMPLRGSAWLAASVSVALARWERLRLAESSGCNRQVEHGQSAVVPHLSLLEMGGVRLLLHVNQAAVKRMLARSAAFGDFPHL